MMMMMMVSDSVCRDVCVCVWAGETYIYTHTCTHTAGHTHIGRSDNIITEVTTESFVCESLLLLLCDYKHTHTHTHTHTHKHTTHNTHIQWY